MKPYLSTFGLFAALVIVLRVFQLTIGTPRLGTSLVPECVAVALCAALLAIRPSLFFDRRLEGATLALALAAAVAIIVARHAPWIVVVAAIQTAIIGAMSRSKSMHVYGYGFLVSMTSWACAAALPYTSLDLTLLSATRETALALPAFVLAIVVLAQVALRLPDPTSATRTAEIGGFVFALIVFCWFAFRVDGLSLDWVPFHRAPWAAPAQLVRDGHWLLWDVPSQYGFLSEVTVAIFPAASTYEAVYRLCALAIVVQAAMLFLVLRSLGSTIWNYIFALAVSGAVMIGDLASRCPYNGRLYPQIGLRFIWLDALLFVVYMLYARPQARRYVLPTGFAIWAMSIAWSFESALWCTAVWFAALVLSGYRRALLSFVVIPLAWIGALELYYRHGLGHGPDWYAYIEFGHIYATNPVLQAQADPFGPGWLILALLASGVALCAFLSRSDEARRAAPTVAAACVAIIAVSSYYALESYHNRINAVVGTLTFAGALVASVYKRERLFNVPAAGWTLAVWIPLIVTVLTTTFAGNASAVLTPPVLDSDRYEQPIGGELGSLMSGANITSQDRIVLPQSPGANQLENGFVLPFLREGETNNAFRSWLPVSPGGSYGLWYELPIDRQALYLRRFLARDSRGGWLFVEGSGAACNLFGLPGTFRTAAHVASERYSGVQCAR